MDNSVINTLASGLDFGSTRLQAISNNLTNVNTPGYKRKDVSFDALLQSASTAMAATCRCSRPTRGTCRRRHRRQRAPTPAIITENGDSMRRGRQQRGH